MYMHIYMCMYTCTYMCAYIHAHIYLCSADYLKLCARELVPCDIYKLPETKPLLQTKPCNNRTLFSPHVSASQGSFRISTHTHTHTRMCARDTHTHACVRENSCHCYTNYLKLHLFLRKKHSNRALCTCLCIVRLFGHVITLQGSFDMSPQYKLP